MHLCYINFVLKKDSKSLNGGVNKNIDRQTDRQNYAKFKDTIIEG